MCRVFSLDEDDFIVSKPIMAFSGKGKIPQWIDEIDPGPSFSIVYLHD